jgi:hypothetical protein
MTRRPDRIKSKQKRTHRHLPQLMLGETLKLCPYRSLLGVSADLNPDPKQLMRRVGCAIAVLGEEPEPFSERMLTDALTVLAAGKVVLLMSNDRRLRDAANGKSSRWPGWRGARHECCHAARVQRRR